MPQDSLPAQAESSAFQPALYPRAYRLTIGLPRFLIPCSALALIAVTVVVMLPGLGALSWAAAISVAAALALILVRAFKYRVVLHPDAIEIASFRTRRLRRDEIVGRQIVDSFQPLLDVPVRVLRLLQRDGAILDLPPPNQLQTDAAFDAWFADFPVVEVSPAEASSTPLPGETLRHAAERAAAVRQARWLSWTFGGVAAVLLYFVPQGSRLVIAMVLWAPWIAVLIVARSPGFANLPQQFAKWLVVALYLLTVAQAAYAIDAYEPVLWPPWIIAAAAAGGAVVLSILSAVLPHLRTTALMWLAPAAAAYSLAAIFGLNGGVDPAVPGQTAVVERRLFPADRAGLGRAARRCGESRSRAARRRPGRRGTRTRRPRRRRSGQAQRQQPRAGPRSKYGPPTRARARTRG